MSCGTRSQITKFPNSRRSTSGSFSMMRANRVGQLLFVLGLDRDQRPLAIDRNRHRIVRDKRDAIVQICHELVADIHLRAVRVLLDAFHRRLERVLVALDRVEQRAEVVVSVQHVDVVRRIAGTHPRGPRLRLELRRVRQLQHLHRQVPAQRVVLLARDRRCIDRDAVQ